MAFQYGTGSVCPVPGAASTSARMPAIVATTTVAEPHRRPRFHVTSPIGIRYSSERESDGPVR